MTSRPSCRREAWRDEILTFVAIESKDQVQFTVSTGYVDGPLQAQSMQMRPAMFAKALLGSYAPVATIAADAGR